MKRYRVRFTPDAEDDLIRLYDIPPLEIGLLLGEKTLQPITQVPLAHPGFQISLSCLRTLKIR